MNTEIGYIQILKEIKSDILHSRYRIARLANSELLFLYYKIGAKISEKVAVEKWGSKTLQKLSDDLQKEMPGLRGFSYGSLRKMRLFYESWADSLTLTQSSEEISSSITNKFEFCSSSTNELENPDAEAIWSNGDSFIDLFTQVSFTSHYEIITKTKTLRERIFYIEKAALEFWTVGTLRNHLNNKLFDQQAGLPNNFGQTLPEKYQKKALQSFKDQYLFDFLRIADENEGDEKVLENEIVRNIKKFIMSIGNDFAFLGNQYRIIVEEDEYFIDLLFFNRTLQALVAFELKTGKFKPEYAGKMNFYLSALDEFVKKPHENPSIGIILCKEKNNKTVEFAFRNLNTAMGVATYTTSRKLPEQFKNILPDENTLKNLM